MKSASIQAKANQFPKSKKMNRDKLLKTLQIYSLGIIPILLIFLFNYVPMFGVIIAFKDYKYSEGIFGSRWVGFDNFKLFVQSNDFANIAWNTIYLNILFIVVGIVSAILLAVLLYELKSRLATKVYQTILITPNFLSWVVISYMAYTILHPMHGTLNRLLMSFGLESVDWYSTPKAWPIILVISSVWKSVGMDSVIYYASLMGIDACLFEVAKIEGASWWQKVRHVVIPSLTPLIIILTILKIGGIFRSDFGLFYQLTRNVGALYDVTDVMDTYIYRTMRELGDMGISSAAGLLQSVIGFVMVIITNTIVKKIDPERALF